MYAADGSRTSDREKKERERERERQQEKKRGSETQRKRERKRMFEYAFVVRCIISYLVPASRQLPEGLQ